MYDTDFKKEALKMVNSDWSVSEVATTMGMEEQSAIGSNFV